MREGEESSMEKSNEVCDIKFCILDLLAVCTFGIRSGKKRLVLDGEVIKQK